MTRKRAGVVRREPDVPEGTQPHCTMWLIWYVNFIILFQSSFQILTPVRSFNYFKPESSAVPATEIGDTGETEDVAESGETADPDRMVRTNWRSRRRRCRNLLKIYKKKVT